jgi:hypothetical protein
MRIVISTWWLAVAAAALALPCQAGVRKCTDAGGRVVYQDAHCDAAASPASPAKPAVSVDVRASDKPKGDVVSRREAPPAQGAWRGAAQFRYVSGAPLDASADADIELALLPDGRLEGGAVGAGCRLDGVHAPQQRAKNVVAVDITISGCRDTRFNARYAGQLDATNPARSRLRLHAITAISPVTAEGYRELAMATIDAALRR